LTVHTGKSHLRLPIRPPRLEDATLRELEEPEQAAASEWTPLTHGEYVRRTTTDPDTGDLVTTSRSGFDEDGNVAMARLDIADITGGDGMNVETRIHPEDPTRASAWMMQRTELRREEWQIAVETEIRISCTNTEFLVHARLDAWEGTDRVFHRSWDERLRREGL
jgi:hypothetical protein